MNHHDNHQPSMLIYGRNEDGNLTHVKNASRGVACGLVCPACGDSLVARQGKKNEWHFAHYTNECGKGGGEGAFHKMAVDALIGLAPTGGPLPVPNEHGAIPAYVHPCLTDHPFNAPAFCSYIKRGERLASGIVPDVIAMARSPRPGYDDVERELLIEVYVTHQCGEEKISRIRESGVAAVEYDLSREYREFVATGRDITKDDTRAFFTTVPESDGGDPMFFRYPLRSRFLHVPEAVRVERQNCRERKAAAREATFLRPFGGLF